MKRVLVTGGSIGDVPIIKSLKSAGHFVVTSGNVPADVGHNFSDIYDQCNYTDVKGLISICKKRRIDALVPSSHDLAAIAASYVAAEMHFPGFDTPGTSSIIHNKALLRDSLRESNCSFPEFFGIRSLKELEPAISSLGFPVIIKPVDLTGGNGISVCHNFMEAEFAFLRAFNLSPSNYVIVESFLSGTYHGITCILEGGRVVFSFADDEYYLYDQFRVSATSSPSSLSNGEISNAISQVESLSRYLSLCDGLLHTQVLKNKTGIFLIEVCRRTPGDLYPNFVELSTGVDYSQLISKYFLNTMDNYGSMPVDHEGLPSLRVMVMSKKRGVYKGIDGLTIFPPLTSCLWRRNGDFIDEPRKWTAGVLFYSDKNGFDLDLITKIHERVTVTVV